MMKIFLKLYQFLINNNYPNELKINNRKKLSNSEFMEDDKLYHGYSNSDCDDNEEIKLETIRFPDFSCNWGRFSKPEHTKFRENGKYTDGCYSFVVKVARYKNIATPVHDPIFDKKKPNYSHVEVRELFHGEDIFFEPPKNRKKESKSSKSRRLEYRQNILANLLIEIRSS